MAGSLLQEFGEFQIFQFIVHADAGRLGASIVRHRCAQPEFRARVKSIVGENGEFHRFENVDQGQLAERLGIQQGDIYLVFRENGWELGTMHELQQAMSSGEDFALNVLRDLSPSMHHCVENHHDDLMMEEEVTSTEKTEESASPIIDEEQAKTTPGVTRQEDTPKPPPEAHAKFSPEKDKEEQVDSCNDDDDDDEVSGKEIEADVPGYRVLEFVLSDHYQLPLGADFVEHRCTNTQREALGDFLDSTEPFDSFFQFKNVTKDGISHGAGIRQDDILLRFFKKEWFLGKPREVDEKHKINRNFRIHVLRKDSSKPTSLTNKGVAASTAAARAESQQPEVIDIQSTDDEHDEPLNQGKRRSSRIEKNSTNQLQSTPINFSEIASVESERTDNDRTPHSTSSKGEAESPSGKNYTVALQVSGYEILKGHVPYHKHARAPVAQFGAVMKEEDCPRDFSTDLRGFFPKSDRRLRFVRVEGKAREIGIRPGDIFVHSFKKDWRLGTREDFESKAKKPRGFFIYFMRKQERQGSTPSASAGTSRKVATADSAFTVSSPSPALGKRRRDSDAMKERVARRRSPRMTNMPSPGPDQRTLYMDSEEDESIENDHDETEQGVKPEHSATPQDESVRDGGLLAKDVPDSNAGANNLNGASLANQPEQSTAYSQTPHPVDDTSRDLLEGLNLAELSKRLVEQQTGADNKELMRHIENSLTQKDLEKFVCFGGLCHASRLLKHADEAIQVCGWKVVLAAHSHMPQCHSSLVDLGLYRRIIQSLQECRTKELFEILVDVLVSPILGTDACLQAFASLDGAVPSVIMAIDRQLGSTASYISCCRFLANVIAGRR